MKGDPILSLKKYYFQKISEQAPLISTVYVRPCIHKLFPCELFRYAAVTRSNDGGRDRTTSQQHYDTTANWQVPFSDIIYKGIQSEKETSQLEVGS